MANTRTSTPAVPTVTPNNAFEEAFDMFQDWDNGYAEPRIKAGTYTVTLIKDNKVDNQDLTKRHINLYFKVEGRHTTYPDTRFPAGYAIMKTQLCEQLKLDQGISMNALKAQLKLGVLGYFSYNTDVNGKQYLNLNFLPPIVPVNVDDDADDADF